MIKITFLFFILFPNLVLGDSFFANICKSYDYTPSSKDRFLEDILIRKSQLMRNYVLLIGDGKESKKNRKKANKKSDVENYNLLIDLVEDKEFCHDPQFKHVRMAFDIDFALRTEGKSSPLIENYLKAKSVLKTHEITKNVLLKDLPTNLFDPEQGKVLSQAELETLIRSGEDISLLDPVNGGEFWQGRENVNFDIVENFYYGQKLYEAIDIEFPTSGKLKKIRKTQTKPKIDFTADIQGKKTEFKLKIGAEIYSEITASVLSSSLGFYTDLSKYVKNFKITLPKKYSLHDLKVDWYSYFDKYEYEKFIVEEGTDSEGRSYVVFREGLIEMKPKSLNRVGAWAWGEYDHKSFRETRGMSLFNMWIANNDIKESGNNKYVLKRNKENGSLDSYKYQHDLGFSFGYFFREKPNDFLWNIIKHNNEDSIGIYYRSFQDNSGFEHMNYWDAKWMVRKIAKLSRTQIQDAVSLGGWPLEAGLLITEKLISRRNDLVKNFELDKEYPLMKVEDNISYGALVNGKLMQTKFEGSDLDFKDEFFEFLDPVLGEMRKLAIRAGISAVKYFDKIHIEGDDLGVNTDILGEVQITVDRKIVSNPIITSRDDRFLVHDLVKIRYGLGGGKVLRGKVNYVKNYELVYPASTLKEAQLNNGFIFNALLPRHVRVGKLPETYVLILEDGLEFEGEVLLDLPSFPVDLAYSQILGKLSRTVISKKNDSYEVYRDVSPYISKAKSLYADLFIFRIPLWHTPQTEGLLERLYYKVNLKQDKYLKLAALDDLLANGQMDGIEKFGRQDKITSDYVTERKNTDLFGFYTAENAKRLDTITVSKNKKASEEKLQLNIYHKKSWNLLGDGELYFNGFQFEGSQNEPTITPPGLSATFQIFDKATTTKEFEAYLKFVDKITLSQDFLSFDPKRHTINNNWGYLKTEVKLYYDQKTLDKMIAIDEESILEHLSLHFKNISKSFWKRRQNFRTSRKGSVELNELRSKFQAFLIALNIAKESSGTEHKYIILAEALDKIIWKSDESFNLIFFNIIHEIIGKESLSAIASIGMPESIENTLPMKLKLFNVLNRENFRKMYLYNFEFEETLDIWDNFMQETPTIF